MNSQSHASSSAVCGFCRTTNSPFNPHCKSCGKDLPLFADQDTHPLKDPLASAPSDFVLTGGRLLPQSLGRYLLHACLKKKEHVEVYRAKDTLMRRDVVIKAHLNKDAERVWQVELLKEARALACLNHPHIAQVFDCLQLGMYPCLVMEWVPGSPLGPEHGAALDRFKMLVKQIFDALIAAHQHGLVHRDLKPDHILVCADNLVKLIDFGLVKRSGPAMDSLPETPEAMRWKGTPAYMAPEQIMGEVADGRSDMFSLAVTLSQCLFGHHPFEHPHTAILLHRICHHPPQLASCEHPLAASRIEHVLRRALAKKPQQRWGSMEMFRDELLEAMESREISG